MLILALDTAMAACSAAVWRDGATLAARRQPMARGQAEALVPLMQAVMAEAGIADYADLDRIAVTQGPGSFTGLRVGLATARAVAVAADRPVIGITTTEALAAAVPAELRGNRPVLAVIDSKRADLFLQWFGPDISPLGPPESAEPEALRARLTEQPAVVVGDAVAMLGDLPAGCIDAGPDLTLPDPAVVAGLAAAKALPEAPPGALYIRPPDATLPVNGGRLRP
ncbi:tRNA (adenosine(37)-N6)-threonylcarbamoyltransferase complex dimerization subunit type 1 TsaB [Caenispirillum salinarum]|uniref:tRNA (adenosine(37)-N6)-threonylcarbamoyltransferase complex dimerization subunit type 1 TsaB n=1 Tax=Caenispirillum salinarum TaxID=859058 RepID=UPI00384BDC7E